MTLSKKPYKGTRDFFPSLKREQNYLFEKMQEAASLFAYEPYDGPMLEEVELYKAKSGEELINDQIYSFYDRGKRFVAIRPEMTPTLARMIAQIHREYPKPIRWYSIPNLMRYERPQKGRLREHWQLNCDIFGAPEGQGELEVLQVAIHLLKSFGANANHFEVLFNDRRVIETIFKDIMQLDAPTTYKLFKIVDASKKLDEIGLEKLLDELKLPTQAKVIFKEYLGLETTQDLVTLLQKHNYAENAMFVQKLIEQARNLGIEEYLKFDPAIVRGLDYYTGLVFEIFDKHPDNRKAICGGGAYADLLKIFNEPLLPGVGFGLGDVRLTDFLKTHNLMPDFSSEKIHLFLTFQTSAAQGAILKLAQALRAKGLKVMTQLDPIKFKKLFPLAEKRGASFVGFMGEDELTQNKIQIKNLTSKDQQTFSLDSELDKIFKYCDGRGNNQHE